MKLDDIADAYQVAEVATGKTSYKLFFMQLQRLRGFWYFEMDYYIVNWNNHGVVAAVWIF